MQVNLASMAASLLVAACLVTTGLLGGCAGASGTPAKATPTQQLGQLQPSPTSPGGGAATPVRPAPSPTAAASVDGAAVCARSAADAVRGYLTALDESRYAAALAFLDHPKAVVWPALGIVEGLVSAPVPADVVHIANVQVSSSASFGPETLCVSQAYVSPGKEAVRFGVTEQGERALAFWAIQRGDCWKLTRGGPVSDQIRAMLASGFVPFRNLTAAIPPQATRGLKFNLSFEMDLHPALGKAKDAQVIEGIALLFQPEPDLPTYPKGEEQVFAIPNSSRSWPKLVRIGESQTVEGIVVGAPEVPSDLHPGKYRLYLGFEDRPGLYWPVQPYLVEVR